MTTAQRATYADLMAHPEDEYLRELVRGEIVRMPPPQPEQGDIEAALVGALERYLHDTARDLGWEPRQGRTARSRLVGYLASGEAGIRFNSDGLLDGAPVLPGFSALVAELFP